jgi:hypothetical protein
VSWPSIERFEEPFAAADQLGPGKGAFETATMILPDTTWTGYISTPSPVVLVT